MLISFTAVWSRIIQIAGDLIDNQENSSCSLMGAHDLETDSDEFCMTREKKEFVMQDERNFLSHAVPRSTRSCSNVPPLSKLHLLLPVR